MKSKLILSALFAIISFPLKAQLDTIPLTIGCKTFLDSKITGEKFEIWIRIPDNSEKVKNSMSLLILLDGDEYFKMASDVVELFEWSEKMPPTVIVGQPSTTESRWKYYTPTNQPYKEKSNPEDSLLYSISGKFELFANFINAEFIPEVSALLKTNFISKTIFGHS
ncbi:MAG: alpha/beta hydrolase-fold protein, partial [Niabella sp.]